MGLGGISPWQLLILLAIVLAIFGTKKLRNIGGDLGSAMRDFRGAMRDSDSDEQDNNPSEDDDDQRVVNHQASENADAGAQTRNTSESKTGQTTEESGQNKS
ncbi:twin-arginine translocase TatA/TatE family subunit [Salinisphaera sp. USBA-960]|uniref:twin-arginine translocase TatA/TatE family subunit n=1 Tax=Salinisphaera orenii TaxID=856731 RepID=UPI000DBE4BA5|nr:twin-arginine translocase TatA/TatE family subunit [Salifodinibacter halophilus]NNC25493.1 twin-arginine translocase TatA/TatE family subunit [Salifodinibacter halophilus]